MLEFGTKRTNVASSLAYPLSGTGLLLLLAVTATMELIRFTVSIFEGGMAGLSAAGIVVLDVMALAYLARYLLVAVETTAEGYDAAPGPPDPREAEEVFGAAIKLLSLLFFCFLPLLVIEIFSLDLGVATLVVLGLGAAYFPMGMLAMAVTGDLTRCFPGTVVPSMFAAHVRYLGGAVLCVLAGGLIYLGYAGPLARQPLVLLIALDLAAAWVLIASLTRMGVLHREQPSLQKLIPFPEPENVVPDLAIPRAPMTEIERILADREKRNS